jgi:hypothetical protein
MALMLSAGLAACASQASLFERPEPVPANYRAEIVSFMRTYLNDPTGVREASLSQPSLQQVGGQPRYVVCTRFNPRNAGGGYIGLVDVAFAFQDGKLYRNFELANEEEDQDRAVRAKLREVCTATAYAPFPELERLTR